MSDDVPVLFTEITTGIQTACAVAAVVAGFFGFTTWKRQFRNTEDHALSRDLLRAAYGLRDGINIIRNSFSFVRMRDDDGNNLTPDQVHQEKVNMYNHRVNECGKRRSDLEVKITEAEALWGVPVRDWFMPLIQKHSELIAGLHTMLDSESPTISQYALEQNRELFTKARKTVYSESISEPDDFDKKVIAALEKIRDYLKPKMITQ